MSNDLLRSDISGVKSFLHGYASSWVIALTYFSFGLYATINLLAFFVSPIVLRGPKAVFFILGLVSRVALIICVYMVASAQQHTPIGPNGIGTALSLGFIALGPESGSIYELGVLRRVNLQQVSTYDLFRGGNELSYRGTIQYSVGPDGVDDEGLIIYDPTNGVVSTGDILLR